MRSAAAARAVPRLRVVRRLGLGDSLTMDQILSAAAAASGNPSGVFIAPPVSTPPPGDIDVLEMANDVVNVLQGKPAPSSVNYSIQQCQQNAMTTPGLTDAQRTQAMQKCYDDITAASKQPPNDPGEFPWKAAGIVGAFAAAAYVMANH